MAHKKYTCPRCGYVTHKKSNIVNHFNRLTICSGSENDIELTDDIKSKVLMNRIYKIPKPVKLIEERFRPNTINGINSCQYLYLIREREHVLHCEEVYKTGQTIAEERSMTINRYHTYGKGSEIILIIQCIDCVALEKKVLKVFNDTFKKHIFGTESFIGNKKEMCAIITEMVYNEEKEVKEIKAKMNNALLNLKEKKNEAELPNKSQLFYKNDIIEIMDDYYYKDSKVPVSYLK